MTYLSKWKICNLIITILGNAYFYLLLLSWPGVAPCSSSLKGPMWVQPLPLPNMHYSPIFHPFTVFSGYSDSHVFMNGSMRYSPIFHPFTVFSGYSESHIYEWVDRSIDAWMHMLVFIESTIRKRSFHVLVY